jgi:Spy/CpxP family protein refolding chaperone
MKKILITTVIAGMLLTTVSVGVLAKGGRPPKPRGAYHQVSNSRYGLGGLNLTFEQQKQILAIRKEFQRDFINIRFALQQKHLELRALYGLKNVDKKKVAAEKETIKSLREQLAQKMKAMDEQIKTVLTPEQLQRFNEPKLVKGKYNASRTYRFRRGKKFSVRPQMAPGVNGFFAKDLNLTIEQQQKLIAIQQQFQLDTLDLRFAIQLKNIELRELWSAKPLDQEAIETKTKEIAGLRVQFVNKGQAMKEAMKSVLTAEQQKQLDVRMKHRNGDKFRVRK